MIAVRPPVRPKIGERHFAPGLKKSIAPPSVVVNNDHPCPKRVIDLGGRTGNALPVLAARFPKAMVVGVDSSPAMLEKARSAGFTTQLAEIATWSPPEPMDVKESLR